jgi:hypothetical protein
VPVTVTGGVPVTGGVSAADDTVPVDPLQAPTSTNSKPSASK